VCLESAAELSEPLVPVGDGDGLQPGTMLPGTLLRSQPLRPSEAATAELAVAAAREVAFVPVQP